MCYLSAFVSYQDMPLEMGLVCVCGCAHALHACETQRQLCGLTLVSGISGSVFVCQACPLEDASRVPELSSCQHGIIGGLVGSLEQAMMRPSVFWKALLRTAIQDFASRARRGPCA